MASSPNTGWTLLTLALLGLVALGIVGLLSAVLWPHQATAALIGVGVLGGFLLLQLAVFRLFGLRSAADRAASEQDAEAPDDSDWRAWRG